MDPWFRRFELEQSQERTYCHADRRDQIQREHNSHQPIIIGRKAPKFLKSLSGNLGISGPKGDPIWTRAGVCWPMPLLPSRFL